MPAKKVAKTAKTGDSTLSPLLWAYVGTDELRVKEMALAKSRELSAHLDEMGLEIVEGAADNTDHVVRIVGNTIEALQTLPFFGGDKVVWLRGVTFLADTVTGRSAGTIEATERLMKAMQSLPPDVKFILSAAEIDKRRSFYLTLKKVANLVVHDLIDTSKAGWEEQVARMVADRGHEYGLRFDDEALDLFTMLAGEDTRQIENELEKLDLYLGETRRVQAADVRAIVSQTKGGVVFELGNAIGKRQLAYALALVDQLIEQGETAIGILLAAIVPKVRNLNGAKSIEERYQIRPGQNYANYVSALERLPDKEKARLPKKKDGSGLNVFPLFLAAKEATQFTGAELRMALEECLKANRRLVTTSMDPTIVLNQLLVRVLSGR